MLIEVPQVLCASMGLPASTYAEWIAYARAHPGRLSYESPGSDTTPHAQRWKKQEMREHLTTQGALAIARGHADMASQMAEEAAQERRLLGELGLGTP